MNFKIKYINRNSYEIPYTYKVFAGGEIQVRLTKFPVGTYRSAGARIEVDGLIKSSDMFFELAMICDALRHELDNPMITANLHYLPYARQDRVCSPGEAFALAQFIKSLKSIRADVFIFDDVHSKVASDHLSVSGLSVILNTQGALICEKEYLSIDDLVLVSPDKGAQFKTEALAWYAGLNMVQYNKIRDLSSGLITETTLESGSEFIDGVDCLIVDDICDGGRTFIPIIKDLFERGAKTVSLCVTHAILPYGLDALQNEGLNNFFYVNSFLDNDLDGMYHVSRISEVIGK